MARRVGFALSIAMAAALMLAAIGAQAESHIRIVRLSYIDGQVQMSHAGDQKLDRAILNAPIVEGMRLVTGSSGLAEVEFENRSSLRLADDSEVQFKRLLMNDSGAKVNEIEVVRGVVYLDLEKSDDIYRVLTKGESFLVRKGTELRLTSGEAQTQVAVFKGEVQFEGEGHPLEVKKKQTLTLSADKSAAPAMTSGIDGVSYDAWNNERSAYTTAYTQNASTFGGPPVNGYGLQDLNYYGGFFYAPGFGYAWQPYGLTGVSGWNPYMMGAWAFDQGLGYSFASAYPWGWLPYHYGSWAYIPTTGWAWLPGNGSTYKGTGIVSNYHPMPSISKAPAGFTPVIPPASMTAERKTILLGSHDIATPAAIPGGRVPPDFRSVLPGTVMQGANNPRVQPGSTFTKSAAVSHTQAVVTPTAVRSSGHVFASPQSPAAAGNEAGIFGSSARGSMGPGGASSIGRTGGMSGAGAGSTSPRGGGGHSSGGPAGH